MTAFRLTVCEKEFSGGSGSPIALTLPINEFVRLTDSGFILLSLLNYYKMSLLTLMDGETLYNIEHIVMGTASSGDDIFGIYFNKGATGQGTDIEFSIAVHDLKNGQVLGDYSGSTIGDMNTTIGILGFQT
jgi:hypothetical protein